MKKRNIIFLIIFILLLSIIYLISNNSKNNNNGVISNDNKVDTNEEVADINQLVIPEITGEKEDLYIDISEFYNGKTGIFEKIVNNELYLVVVYPAKKDLAINLLNVVVKDGDKEIETIPTHSNTRILKNGEIGYFVAKATKFNQPKKYNYYIDVYSFQDVPCTNVKEHFSIYNDGYIESRCLNTSENELEYKNGRIILKDIEGNVIDDLILYTSKLKYSPDEEVVIFTKTSKSINDIDMSKSEIIIDLE